MVGGTAALSDQVRRYVESICDDSGTCITTRRIDGKNRIETATLLADELVRLQRIPDPDWMPTHVNLARGDLLPDAAVGGPQGGTRRGASAEAFAVCYRRDSNQER